MSIEVVWSESDQYFDRINRMSAFTIKINAHLSIQCIHSSRLWRKRRVRKGDAFLQNTAGRCVMRRECLRFISSLCWRKEHLSHQPFPLLSPTPLPHSSRKQSYLFICYFRRLVPIAEIFALLLLDHGRLLPLQYHFHRRVHSHLQQRCPCKLISCAICCVLLC